MDSNGNNSTRMDCASAHAFPRSRSVSFLALTRRAQILCVAALASVAPALAQSGTFQPNPALGTREAMLPQLYASSHAANLLVLKDGDILCVWFSGTAEGQSNVGIVLSRLPKGSDTWQPTMLVDREAGKSYQNPVLFQEPAGRIWIFHTTQTADKGQADAQVLRVYSDDDGKTWSKPEVLFSTPGSFTRQPVVILPHDEWLLPIFYTPSAGITTGADSNYSAVKISPDHGKTWRECRLPHSNGLVHPNVLRLSATSYVVFLRSRYADWIYRATSTDGCRWTDPVKTVLPNNNASIQATRLRNGDIVMAFDNSSAPGNERKPQTGPRVPLSVAISKDDGKTWSAVRDLEVLDKHSDGEQHFPSTKSRDEFSYPSITQAPSGQILVAYTYRRIGIKVAEFSESWIAKGTTTGKFSPGR
jgi:predicted neuraminidase